MNAKITETLPGFTQNLLIQPPRQTSPLSVTDLGETIRPPVRSLVSRKAIVSIAKPDTDVNKGGVVRCVCVCVCVCACACVCVCVRACVRVSEWKKRVVCLLDSFKCTLHTHTNTGINKLTCKTDYIQTYKASYITRLKRDSVFQLNHAVKAAATDTVRFCFKLLYVKQCGADLTEHTQSPIATRH